VVERRGEEDQQINTLYSNRSEGKRTSHGESPSETDRQRGTNPSMGHFLRWRGVRFSKKVRLDFVAGALCHRGEDLYKKLGFLLSLLAAEAEAESANFSLPAQWRPQRHRLEGPEKRGLDAHRSTGLKERKLGTVRHQVLAGTLLRRVKAHPNETL